MNTNKLFSKILKHGLVEALFVFIVLIGIPMGVVSAQSTPPATPSKTPATTSTPAKPLDQTKYVWEECKPGEVKQEIFGIPTWYKYLPSYKDPATKVCLPLAGQSFDPTKLNVLAGIGLAIIEILLRLVVFVTIIFVTYGGFQYLISQGEPDRVRSAKDTILNALIGLVIAMLATVLVNFIGRSLS